MKLLEGKVAVVTGAARGIGKAIALQFAKEGADVAFTDLTIDENGKATEAEIAALGVKAKGYASNAADFEQTHKVIEEIVKDFGRIDILVNNAGMSSSEPFSAYTPELFRKVMSLNLDGPFNCCRAVYDTMAAQKSGVILNTSSMVSKYAQPGGVAYPTSKFAINGMTLALARELGPQGIRVNAVAPGITNTDMMKAVPESVIAPLVAQIPLRRIGEPEDIAEAFLFLASDRASYITGQVIHVDGQARS